MRIIRPLSEPEYQKETPAAQSYLGTCSLFLSSLRICSEWGVGGPQQTFHILRKRLPVDDLMFGALIWELCLRLFNLRVRLMKEGQIYKVFCE
jgi:hypothetical protein